MIRKPLVITQEVLFYAASIINLELVALRARLVAAKIRIASSIRIMAKMKNSSKSSNSLIREIPPRSGIFFRRRGQNT